MTVKPIRNKSDHERALKRVEQLWNSPAGSAKADELDVLVTLIEAYEEAHYPMDKPDPLDAIRFRLEQSGRDLRSLTGIIGQRTRVYEVMRGDRPLSLEMIRSLHRHLQIPAEVLISPSKKTRPKKVRVGYKRSA